MNRKTIRRTGIWFAIVVSAAAGIFGSVNAAHHETTDTSSPQSVADRLDILQVIAEYSYTFDGRDSEGWAALFTEDASWQFIAPGSPEPLTDLNGRDEILAWAKGRHASMPKDSISYHHQSGISFDELTADTAKTRVMVIITAHTKGSTTPPAVFLTGVYHDEWKKTAEGWKFVSRTLKG